VGEVMKWTASGWACAADDGSGGSGDITEVTAGTGLTGGSITGAVTLGVDVGTTAGQIVQMAAGDKLPAVDGSDLVNVNAVKLQTRSVASTAPSNGDVLKWNSTTSVWEPTADTDTGITALTGDVSASGTGSVAATLADSVVTSAKVADGTIATADIADDAVTAAKLNAAGVGVNRLLITDSSSGTRVQYATCSNDEVLKWTASGWACSTMGSLISGSYFTQDGNSLTAQAIIGTNDAYPLHIETDGSTRMTVTADGKVGIGTTGPANFGASGSLDPLVTVNGTLGVAGEITFGNKGYGTPSDASDGWRIRFSDLSLSSTYIGFGAESSLGGIFAVTGSSSSGMRFYMDNGTGYTNYGELKRRSLGGGLVISSVSDLILEPTGNVGIGTTSPAAKLDVSGSINVSASTEGTSAYVNSSTAYTIPDSSMNIRRITLTGNATITMPAFTAPSQASYSLTVFVKQDGTGSRTVTFAGAGSDTIKWDSGATPSIASAAGKVTILQFLKPSDETVWYASMVWKEN
ncbi:MAG: hypothetical protein AB7P49_03740, partial [Bdellovibrionales bacterium]